VTVLEAAGIAPQGPRRVERGQKGGGEEKEPKLKKTPHQSERSIPPRDQKGVQEKGETLWKRYRADRKKSTSFQKSGSKAPEEEKKGDVKEG